MEKANFLLVLQLKALGLPPPKPEYRFHPTRQWRLDLAWPKRRIGVEVDGEGFRSRVSGDWVPGRHHRTGGIRNDMEKLNAATELGWRVFRFVPAWVADGTAAKTLARVLGKKRAAA
jgi:very-short-patch-repair endonuclease